ncbi:MAG: tetratricopeptide repeat protein [Muribaculaceae bacterium]|nr:tetratricopeptide repeat protein [Muribaculaceae bacterium]
MAKKETRTSIEELNESLSSIEQKVENNKKIIVWALGAIVVVAAIVLGYIYGVRNPNLQNAKNEIGAADMEQIMGNDSLALDKYKAVAANYSNAPANRANLNAAIILYQQGKFSDAAQYLKDFDPEGVLVGPASQSLLGDCYVNLDQFDEAIKSYEKAISLSNDNPYYTPLFILKKATVLHEKQQYADEAKAYETIKEKYPDFSLNYNIDVDKYLERAKLMTK